MESNPCAVLEASPQSKHSDLKNEFFLDKLDIHFESKP